MTRFTVDTNILIYSHDRTDKARQAIAEQCVLALHASRGPLPLQCLSEFYRATTRKSILSPLLASEVVRDFLDAIEVLSATASDLHLAMELHRSEKIQFFDALLFSTAVHSGCSFLFTEDFQTGRVIGSCTILNPFTMTQQELRAVLA